MHGFSVPDSINAVLIEQAGDLFFRKDSVRLRVVFEHVYFFGKICFRHIFFKRIRKQDLKPLQNAVYGSVAQAFLLFKIDNPFVAEFFTDFINTVFSPERQKIQIIFPPSLLSVASCNDITELQSLLNVIAIVIVKPSF